MKKNASFTKGKKLVLQAFSEHNDLQRNVEVYSFTSLNFYTQLQKTTYLATQPSPLLRPFALTPYSGTTSQETFGMKGPQPSISVQN
jgi:hypothetical protein